MESGSGGRRGQRRSRDLHLGWWRILEPGPGSADRSLNKLIRVRCFDGGIAWAVGVMGMILQSEDWGASWERRAEEVDVAWNDIAFADPKNGWVAREFGTMMHRPGRWHHLAGTCSSVAERSLMAISFRDQQSAVAVGLDGLIIQTTDAGENMVHRRGRNTSLHLFDVAWVGGEWVAVGGMGVLVTGSPGTVNRGAL